MNKYTTDDWGGVPVSDIVSSNVIIIVAVLLFILFQVIYLFTKHMAAERKESPDQTWKKKNGKLLMDLQAGFNKVTSQSTRFREQIRILEAAVGKSPGTMAIDAEKATRFNQNSLSINQLTCQYSMLSQELHNLVEQENGISSPEVLHYQRLKEIETIQQLSAISEKIEPLLQENVEMVSLSELTSA